MAKQNALVNPSSQMVVQASKQAASTAEGLAETITGISGPDQAVVREILPDEDLESGGDSSWDGNDREWVQSGLSIDVNNETYTIDSNSKAQNKVVVLYGFANVNSDPITTEVSLDDGTGATFFRMNTQLLQDPEVSNYVLFDEPQVFGTTEGGAINQWSDTDASDDYLVLLGKVAEPLGETLSTRDRATSRLASR